MSNKLFASNKHTSSSFSCRFQTSRWTWKPRDAAEKTNVLFVAAIFSSFYSQICVFASRPSRLLSYLSNMMLCNNFYEHLRMLHDWLKNIIRLFSAYLNKETREELLCHAWKSYLGVSWILLVTSKVMSILRNLERIKARRKANPKETRCDIDLTKSLDSVNLTQRTHQGTMSSYSETNLGILDYEKARDAGTSGLKKSRSNYQKYFPNERYNIGKHASESSKRNFHN